MTQWAAKAVGPRPQDVTCGRIGPDVLRCWAQGCLDALLCHGCRCAFGLLRSYSNHHNVKLSVLAERMVVGFADPTFDRDKPLERLLDILNLTTIPAENRDTA